MADCSRCGKKIGALMALLYPEKHLCFGRLMEEEKTISSKARGKTELSSETLESTPLKASKENSDVVAGFSETDREANRRSEDSERKRPEKSDARIYRKAFLVIIGLLSVIIVLLASRLFFSSLPQHSPQPATDISTIVSQILPGTVFIRTEKKDGRATGSGFFIGNKIFTNAHVVANAKKIFIKTHSGKNYEADIWDVNEDLDLAILTSDANANEYESLMLASDIPEPGSTIIVVGSPLGYEQTISNGLISAVRKYDNDLPLLQISAPISPGSSGSPVIDMRGQVVGIATLSSTKGQNLNFAVSPTSIHRTFSKQDEYLVQVNAPIVTDESKKKLLRMTPLPFSGTARSPEGERVKILDSSALEIRTLTKVQSLRNHNVYWVDSNAVKRPLRMAISEFVKFDELGLEAEKILQTDFQTDGNVSVHQNGKNTIRLELDKNHHISQVIVNIFRETGQIAEVHPWILQTVKAFYPNSIISDTFYKDLLGMVLESVVLSHFISGHHAVVEKFPVLFDMNSQASSCTLTVSVGKQKPKDHKTGNVSKPEKTDSSPKLPQGLDAQERPRRKKTNVRDEAFLKEIRTIIYGMQTEHDVFEGRYFYSPEKYSTYVKKLMLEPYISHGREEGRVTLFCRVGFSNPDWVFTEKVIINCDGKNYPLVILDDPVREVLWGGEIYEIYTTVLLYNASLSLEQRSFLQERSLLQEDAVKDILKAKKVQIRFDGKTRVADRTLSKKDIQNLAKAYDVYKKLVALEARWSQ